MLFTMVIYFLLFVYLQFVFEGMEESGSEGLDDLVFSLKDTFLKVLICLCQPLVFCVRCVCGFS